MNCPARLYGMTERAMDSVSLRASILEEVIPRGAKTVSWYIIGSDWFVMFEVRLPRSMKFRSEYAGVVHGWKLGGMLAMVAMASARDMYSIFTGSAKTLATQLLHALIST